MMLQLARRAEFVDTFAQRPCYFIRAAGCLPLIDKVEKVL